MTPEDAPRTMEQRAEIAVDAVRRMTEALNDFINTQIDVGDAQVLEHAYVIFQSRGISAEGGTFWAASHMVLEHEGSYNTAVGLLATQMEKLLERLNPENCCDD